MLKGKSLEDIWVAILESVWENGHEVLGIDGGMLEILNLSFCYSNPFLVNVPKYKTHVPGDFISNIAKVYEKEGEGWEGKHYGTYFYSAHGVDQIEKVISILRKDPLSKSALVLSTDGSLVKSPCIILLNFSIRDHRLNMNVVFKSADVVKKFVPDMLAISKIHKYISSQLMVGRGEVSGLIFSAQIHHTDETLVKDILDNTAENESFNLDEIVRNWDIAAAGWEKSLEDESHYVNFEDCYERFTNHLIDLSKDFSADTVQKAIDLGSGTSFIAQVLGNRVGTCDVLDISPKMLERSRDISGKILLSNVLDIPTEDSYYDFAVSRGVLISHIGPNNAEKMLNEVYRVLKPDALFYLDYITKFEDTEIRHKRTKNAFSTAAMEDVARRCGFVVERNFDNDAYRVTSILLRKKRYD